MRRIVIITGAGSGIGAALSEAMAQRGDTVVAVDIDAEAADATAARIVTAGGRAESAQADVSDAEAVQGLVDRVVNDHGRIDVMVNNAGIGTGGPIEDLVLDHWRHAMDVNVMGVVNGVHAVYPVMIAQGSGHILNTASLAGLVPAPMLTPYAATKHAVVGLSLTLRPEAARHGIHVSVLCPGPVETPILDSTGPAHLPQAMAGLSARELLTKASGTPYPVERLAQDAIRGLECNTAVIVTPRRAHMAWLLYRFSPSLWERGGRRIVGWAYHRIASAAGAQSPDASRSHEQ